MEVSLRGVGTFVPAIRGMGLVNPDGTISLTIDPTASDITATALYCNDGSTPTAAGACANGTTPTTTPPNTISYPATAPTGGSTASSTISDQFGNSCTVAQWDAIDNLCPGSTGYNPCPTGQVMSGSACVAALFGLPQTTVIALGAALLVLIAMLGGKR